jgi:hypothetical protein
MTDIGRKVLQPGEFGTGYHTIKNNHNFLLIVPGKICPSADSPYGHKKE